MRWDIPANDSRIIARGVVPLLPLVVNPETTKELRARILIRLRGGGDAWVLTFHDGVLAVTAPEGRRVDCRISADPTTFLLSSYSRVGPVRAATGGKVAAWGRRPALAFRLSSYLSAP